MYQCSLMSLGFSSKHHGPSPQGHQVWWERWRNKQMSVPIEEWIDVLGAFSPGMLGKETSLKKGNVSWAL